MNVLFIVTWYSEHDKPINAGLFHYEMAKAIQKYSNVAIYWPNDTSMSVNSFTKYIENGIVTYRRGSGVLPKDIAKFSKIKRIAWKISNKLSSLGRVRKWKQDLRNIGEDFKPDVIHSHCGLIAGYVVAKCLNKTPYIITEHTPIEMMHLEKLRTKNKWKYAYENSKANICVSDDLQKKLSIFFPNIKFDVIYNGINNPCTFLHGKEEKIYKQGFVNGIIVAAFYDKCIKGFQYLLPAVKEIKNKGIKFHLHVLGGGTYLDYYKSMADDLKINDYVTFYGQRDKETVYKYVSQMDFGISASLFESAGVSVEEMQLLGKPVLVTRSGGANSLVRDFSAIVVDKGSKDALVYGLEQMCDKYKEYDCEKIQKFAYESFEMDNICKKYIEIYNNSINKDLY